jgi:putative ABC transport system permease protein
MTVLWLDHLLQDSRSAWRALAKHRVSSAVAVISLAGGIGATVTTLTLRDVVFHRPPPLYRAPQHLSRVQVGSPERPISPAGSPVPAALYESWGSDAAGFTLAAAAPTRVREVRTPDGTRTSPVRPVTPGLFSVLGVDAALGRTFSRSGGCAVEGPAQAVLGFGAWQTLFNGHPGAIGTVIWIENQPHVVVGVMPERFWFSSMDSPVWTCVDASGVAPDVGLDVVVRRDAGVTPAVLARRLETGLTEYMRLRAARQPPARLRLKVSGIEGTPLGAQLAPALPWLLAGAVLLTLLTACANLAILAIAQWTAREREIAIRAALGATRGRLVRALVTESMLIAAAAGLLGGCAAVVLRGVAMRRAGPGAIFYDLSFTPAILLQSALTVLAAAVLSGIGPALVETGRLRGGPMTAFRSSERTRQHWRHALVVLEIAVTVALLVVAAAMLDGYRRNFTADLGYQTHPLLALRVENRDGVPTARLLEMLAARQDVAAAAASTTVPYATSGSLERVATDASGSQAVVAERGSVTSGFFAALGVPVRRGRAFAASEPVAARTAIVNETLARRLFAGRDPIGGRVWLGPTSYEVVGVVADYANTPFQPAARDPKIFLPFGQPEQDATGVQFLVRTTRPPAATLDRLQSDLRGATAGNVVSRAFTLDQVIAGAGQEILVGTAPLVPLVGITMLLTAIGIFGVLAFAVERRSRELALRVALGATSRALLAGVVRHSLYLVACGTGLGVAATFVLTRLVRASGGGGSVFDPGSAAFLPPTVAILVVAAIASWVPSRRALRVNPASLLRTD